MADELRRQLERDLAKWKASGMDEDAAAVEARLAELEPALAEQEPESEDLETFTVVELKDMARDQGIEGFSTMNKAELVEALESKEG